MPLLRIGVWLSAIALATIEALVVVLYLLDRYGGSDPLLSGYLLIGLIYGIPVVACTWLGVFIATIIRKAVRLAKEA